MNHFVWNKDGYDDLGQIMNPAGRFDAFIAALDYNESSSLYDHSPSSPNYGASGGLEGSARRVNFTITAKGQYKVCHQTWAALTPGPWVQFGGVIDVPALMPTHFAGDGGLVIGRTCAWV